MILTAIAFYSGANKKTNEGITIVLLGIITLYSSNVLHYDSVFCK